MNQDKIAKLEEARKEQDKKFVLDRMRWPRWPWLPIKRLDKNGFPWETAAIYADDPDEKTGTVRVWDVNIFRESKPKVIKTYESLDKLFEDGWKVD